MFTLSSYNNVYCLWILITNNYIYQENQIILNEIRWNKQWKGEKEPLASYSIINCFVKAYLVLDKSVSIKHGLRTTDYGLRTGYKIWTRYKTRTRKYGLGIKHGQGIKRGLRTGYKIRTTDYFGKNRANWFQVRKNKIKRSLNSKTRELKL